MFRDHPCKNYFIGLLKQQRAENKAKHVAVSTALSSRAAEFNLHDQNSDIQAVCAENQPRSSLPLMRQGCYDTAARNKGTDDDKMDLCGPEDRKGSVGTLQAAGSGDWFEDSQEGDEEIKINEEVKQGNMRRGEQDHSTERREEGCNRGKRDNRRPQDSDSRSSKDGRGRNSDAKKYGSVKYRIVKEVDGDLFTAPKVWSLAHCVATE
jgi:hypothetical protein